MFRYGIPKLGQDAQAVSGAQAVSDTPAIHPRPDSETPPHQLP